jgi:hypothetical protein
MMVDIVVVVVVVLLLLLLLWLPSSSPSCSGGWAHLMDRRASHGLNDAVTGASNDRVGGLSESRSRVFFSAGFDLAREH